MTTSTRSALDGVGLALPALRGEQGGRTLYLTLPTNAVLTGFFPSEIEGSEDRSQRPLDLAHARQIRDYIVSNANGHALGALVYAVDKAGIFEEVAAGTGIGVLRLPLDARLRSIDGQHRREGIRQAIPTVPELQNQSTAVIIYVEPDIAGRRQMFSDMNNTARKVSKALNVSFDSRDPFARAAVRISEEHLLLKGRVDRLSPRVLQGSGSLFTLAAIYDALKRLFVGPVGRVKDATRYDEGEVIARGIQFFDALSSARPELRELSADELDSLRSKSILLSSTTLRVLASAVWSAAEERADIDEIFLKLPKVLERIDFRPAAGIWQESGFIPTGRTTPNARSQEMKAASDSLAQLIANSPLEERGNE